MLWDVIRLTIFMKEFVRFCNFGKGSSTIQRLRNPDLVSDEIRNNCAFNIRITVDLKYSHVLKLYTLYMVSILNTLETAVQYVNKLRSENPLDYRMY